MSADLAVTVAAASSCVIMGVRVAASWQNQCTRKRSGPGESPCGGAPGPVRARGRYRLIGLADGLRTRSTLRPPEMQTPAKRVTLAGIGIPPSTIESTPTVRSAALNV